METAEKNSFYLREAEQSDAQEIYKVIDGHREYLKTWLPFVANLTEQSEEDFIAETLAVEYEQRNIVFIIEKDEQLCGLIGFVNTDRINNRTEIGYWLLPEFQGQGIMTNAVKYLCRWAVEERNMKRIQIKCAVGNEPSNAIPQRLDFTFEGTERCGELLHTGEYADINVYSILKEEVNEWEEE